MLAFAWIATIGLVGVVTGRLTDQVGIDIYGTGWLFGLTGLIVVYTYFQIPLMVIVFLPALDGLRPQWREAAVNLGATTWQYWRHVAHPAADAGLPRRDCCCCSPTRSRRTPPRPCWSARASPIVPLLIRHGDDQRGAARPGATSASRSRSR